MKSLNHLFKGGLILSATMLFFSCKRQIEEPLEKEVAATVSSASTGCKPTFLGAITKRPNDLTFWTTLMQKWYDGNGRLSNIKAAITYNYSEVYSNEFILPWGVVTYEGNQIYVHDQERLVLRVTLDAQQRAAASYFYAQAPPNQINEIDTSYYYYTGDRLTQIFSIRKAGSSPSRGVMYNLEYDAYGNIRKVFTGNTQGSSHTYFVYDYSKPVNGMFGYYQISMALRMMEYMDLVRFPMHHELMVFLRGDYQPGFGYPNDTYPLFLWHYLDHEYNANNLVEKYRTNVLGIGNDFGDTFYTGWDCGGTTNADPVSRTKISSIESLDDFNKVYR